MASFFSGLDWSTVAGLLGILVSVIAGLTGFFSARRARGEEVVLRQREPLLDRVERLSSVAVLAKVLADEISAEIEVIAARADRLQKDAERAEVLAALNETHRAAVAAVIREELKGDEKKRKRSARLSSFLWFLAGVAGSAGVALFVHPL